jgi:hypothetical protein
LDASWTAGYLMDGAVLYAPSRGYAPFSPPDARACEGAAGKGEAAFSRSGVLPLAALWSIEMVLTA